MNNPINLIDPSGHCTENYKDDADLLDQCIAGWRALNQWWHDFDNEYGGGVPHEWLTDLYVNAPIEDIESLMSGYGIDYDYYTSPESSRRGSQMAQEAAARNRCRYWQDCYDPVGEYGEIGGNLFIGGRIILDDWGNVYLNGHVSWSPSFGATIGNIKVKDGDVWKNIEDLAVDQQELVVQEFLSGVGDGGCVSMGVSACIAGNQAGNYAIEGGLTTPGLGTDTGYTLLVYDNGNSRPWFWQRRN